MKRRFLLTLLIFFCSITLFACGKKEKSVSLSTPTNLVVENQYITFNNVKNASYYAINYDGNVFTIKATGDDEVVFDASKIFSEPKIYEVKVKAIGTGKYVDSDYSAVFNYVRGQVLGTPTIKFDSSTLALTWPAISGASCYTTKITFPNGNKDYYTYDTNSFDVSSILSAVGSYTFQVKAGNKDSNNEYSNEITYKYVQQLSTPSNLKLEYNSLEDEVYLYFIADENSYGYGLNVNNHSYNLIDTDLSTYSEKVFNNLIKVKLSSFLKSKDSRFESETQLSVSVVAKKSATNSFIDSLESARATINIAKVLKQPKVNISTNGNDVSLTWSSVENATRYSIYINYEFFTSVKNDVYSIIFNKLDIENKVLTVQAEGIDSYHNSKMSLPVSVSTLQSADSSTLNITDSIISWDSVDNASLFILEISNSNFYYSQIFDNATTSFDVSNVCELGKYEATLTVFEDDKLPSVSNLGFEYSKTLSKVENAQMGTSYSMYTISFNQVEDASGYLVKFNNVIVDKVFVPKTNSLTATIDLTNYILLTGNYNIEIKAIVFPSGYYYDSEWVSVGAIKHSIPLAKPIISVDENYVLHFEEVDNAYNYTVLVNYISIYPDGVAFNSKGYDLSSYLTSAQYYTIMVKANANPQDAYYTDSGYSTIQVPKYIQLATINAATETNKNGINVELKDGRYFIDFPTQTHAANYDVKIHNTTTDREVKFNILSTPYDITDYVQASGNYKIYVRAMANTDSGYLYLSSIESSNPFVLEKDKPTLSTIKNITISEKVEGSNNLFLSWDKVDNAESYYLTISYANTAMKNFQTTLIEELTVTTNKLNLGDYISLEGNYSIRIKAVAGEEYESSGFSDYAYNHTMTIDSDFKRNKVFMNGQTYSHYVTSYAQLENLINYYYLFNDISYFETFLSSNYNLKIMLGVEIDVLMEECAEANYGFSNSSSALIEKLHAISTQAISNYSEGYYLENNQLSSPVEVAENETTYYVYNIKTGLNSDKTAIVSSNNEKLFEEKQKTLANSLRRKDNYIFAIDMLEKIDVSNTEQLFMAVQYNRSPNFVGNSTVASTIYNNAKDILNTIINDDMTDYQKVVAIYDWLMTNVQYNMSFETLLQEKPNLNDYTDLTNSTLMGNVKYNYLEGVFYDSNNRLASSNGLAKAFVLMCKIEGIDAIKVNGTKNGAKHYWNKVFIDGTPNNDIDQKTWFTVDLASSYIIDSLNSTNYQIESHKYFLVTDSFIKSKLGVVEKYLPKDAVSNTTINYYSNAIYSYSKSVAITTGGSVLNKTYSGSGTLQYLTSYGTAEEYIKDIMYYLVVESDGVYNCVVEVDMALNSTSLTTLENNITTSYYSEVAHNLNASFRIDATSYDSTLLIMVRPI